MCTRTPFHLRSLILKVFHEHENPIVCSQENTLPYRHGPIRLVLFGETIICASLTMHGAPPIYKETNMVSNWFFQQFMILKFRTR